MNKYKRPPKNEPEPVELPKPLQTTGKVTLDLTNEDIIRGYQRSPMNCPLARCGNRCIPGVYSVKIGYGEIIAFFGSKKPIRRFPIPEIVKEYLLKYDETGVMVPFAMEIDLG